MKQIKLYNKISAAGTDLFDRGAYTLTDEGEVYDAILVRSAKLHDVAFPETLQCIARCGAGVNNIPVDACAEKGIVVFNTPGANANAVKELVICALLLASRKIAAGIAWVQALKGQGDQVSPQVEKGKSAFVGPEIAGKTLGIVGLGAIGRLVAGAARALGMEVIGYDPFLTPAAQQELGETVRIVTDLDEIYAQSDYITLHVPATAETKGMICQANIAKMKAGARIINLARGELVVDADVIAALGDGRLGAYVTDFATDALLGVDGVTPLPHLGASTPESEDNCASMAALEVIDFLENGNIKNSVNYPAVALPDSDSERVALCHDAGVDGEALLRQAGLTITAAAKGEKGQAGYTLADVTGVTDGTAAALAKLAGVRRARVL